MSDEDDENIIADLVTKFWVAMARLDSDTAQELLEVIRMEAPREVTVATEGTSMMDHQVPPGTVRGVFLALNADDLVNLALITKHTCGAVQGSQSGVGKFCANKNCVLITHTSGERASVTIGDLVIRHRSTSTSQGYAFTYPRLDSDSLPFSEDVREGAIESLLDLQAPAKVWMLVLGGASRWIAAEAVSREEGRRERLRRELRKESRALTVRAQDRVFELEEDESEEEKEEDDEELDQRSGEDDVEAEELSQRVIELSQEVEDYKEEIDKLKRLVEDLTLASEENETRIEEVADLEKKTYENCIEAMKKIQRKVKTAKHLLAGATTTGGTIDMAKQRKLVVELVKQQGLIQWKQLHPSCQNEKGFEKILTELIHTVLAKGGLLSLLTDRVTHLETRTTEAIEVGGQLFKNQEDVVLFFGAGSGGIPSIRLFMDVKNFLLLAEPIYTTPAAGVEATADSLKGGFASVAEATIITGFTFEFVPVLLVQSSKAEDQRDGGVTFAKRAANPDTWTGSHLGSERERVLTGLLRVKAKTLANINSEYPLHRGVRDSEINAVLTALTNEAYGHAVGLIQSMEPLYMTLKQGGMSSKESWRRVKLYVKGVFEAIHEVRGLADEGTRGAMMWAVLAAHRIASDFHAHQWINHPRVSSILALSALEHEGDTIASLEKDMELLKKEVKGLVDKLKRLTTRVEVVEGKVN